MADLEAMRAENMEAWRRDMHLPDYERQVVVATSLYLPALETEVDRLGAEVDRLRAALRQVMNVGDRAAVAVAHEALGALTEWAPQ